MTGNEARISLRTAVTRLAAVAVVLLWPTTSMGSGESDIALFSSSASAPPNVMLLLDDSGSMTDEPSWCGGGWGWGGWWGGGSCDGGGGWGGWGGWWGGGTCEEDPDEDCRPKWEIMRDAAVNLVETLNPPDGAGGYAQNVRFGVFMFDDNHHGGELIVPIEDDNTDDVIDALQNDINASGSTPLGGTLVDVGRYYKGSSSDWGDLPAFGTLNYDSGTSEQTVTSPMDLECRESFVIALSDGEGQPTDGAKYPNADLWSTVGDADSDGAETAGTDEEWFDDAAYAMNHTDFKPGISGTQNIEVHTIAFDLDGAGATLLENAADYGGGSYHEANAELDLSAAFLSAAANIFAQIGSFTGATVSSSRTRQGDLFINTWFEPSDQPVWQGHMQAFRVAPSGEIQGVDASGDYVNAIDPVTDQIVEDPIWDAADKLAVDNNRRIITADSSFNSTPIDLTIANVSNADLDITDADANFYPNFPGSLIDTADELRAALIAYVRGFDAFDEHSPAGFTDLRPIVLGDIFHSTPVLVDGPKSNLSHEDGYSGFLSSYGTRDRVVYAGSNSGLLHAFDAGEWRSGDDPDTDDVTENGYYSPGTGLNNVNGGSEIFGYLPRRLLDDIKYMPNNAPRINYYVDGTPTVADAWLGDKLGGTAKVKDANEWATVLVGGLRDGGRAYYALDVTDPSSASYPGVLWEFTHDKLGDTWSRAVITRVRISGSAGYGDHCGASDGEGDCREQWVAIFGGGFKSNADPNDEDFGPDSTHPNWTAFSKGIFMVSLETGDLLASVIYDETGATGPDEMIYAIPSAPAVLDLDFDGFADVVYIGDLGGHIWKWDIHEKGTISGGEVTNWDSGVFFQTPPTVMSEDTHYRSFFEPPAATYINGDLYLAFGSGERENLFYGGSATDDENNRFYVIKDPYPTGASAFASTKSETDSDIVNITDGTSSPGASGYYIQVPDGEKFVGEPTIFAGYVIASAFQPLPGSDVCIAATGQSILYVFDVSSGTGYFTDADSDASNDRYMVIGGGMPSKPKVSTGTTPGDDVVYIKTSTGQVIVIDPPPRPDQPVGLIYWRQVL